jgi:hypothetical protein
MEPPGRKGAMTKLSGPRVIGSTEGLRANAGA